MRKIRTLSLLAAAGALMALPAVADAGHKSQHSPSAKSKRCAPVNVGYVVKGTLTAFTADDPATTGTNEASATFTVTGANKHARRSGVDKGESIVLNAAADAFKLQLADFESDEVPNGDTVADKVRVVGKIARTKKRCAGPTYGDVNVRKVKVIDVDAA